MRALMPVRQMCQKKTNKFTSTLLEQPDEREREEKLSDIAGRNILINFCREIFMICNVI